MESLMITSLMYKYRLLQRQSLEGILVLQVFSDESVLRCFYGRHEGRAVLIPNRLGGVRLWLIHFPLGR